MRAGSYNERVNRKSTQRKARLKTALGLPFSLKLRTAFLMKS